MEPFVVTTSSSRMAGRGYRLVELETQVQGFTQILLHANYSAILKLKNIVLSANLYLNYGIFLWISVGIGNYHGKYTYETFIHRKSVVQRSFSKVAEKIYAARYPPYNKWNMKVIANFMKYVHAFEMKGKPTAFLATFLAGAIASVAISFGWLTALKRRQD